MRSLLLSAAALLAICTSAAPSASAATVFSETFAGAVPGGGPSAGGAYNGAIPGTGFSVTNGNVDIVGVIGGSNFSCVNNPTGNCLDLIGNQGVGAIQSTTFNLVAGDQYQLTFNDILQGGILAPENFQVAVGSLFTKTETALSTGTTSVTESFIAATGQVGATLVFTSITNDDNVHGPILDTIKLADLGGAIIVPTSVPEPASLALLGSALLGLLTIRLRQKA